jgi:cell division protease FtsH
VMRWGMGGTSIMAFSSDEEQPFLGYAVARGRDYGEETAARIDREADALLREAYASVRSLLDASRVKLDALAGKLMEKETLEFDALQSLLGDRVLSA